MPAPQFILLTVIVDYDLLFFQPSIYSPVRTCERGFSILDRIKDDLRSSLEDYLEPLMRISSTNMDALTLRTEHAGILIQRWRNKKERRSFGKGDKLRD
jgi:hypothetical protein